MRKITLILSLCLFVFSGFAQRVGTKVDKTYTFEQLQSAKGEAEITDTIIPASFIGGTPALYNSDNTGYVCGANGYGDLAKAQHFNTGGDVQNLEGVMVWVGALDVTEGDLNFVVYDLEGDFPGTALSTTSVPFSQVSSTDVSESGDFMYTLIFDRPVTVKGDYLVSLEFSGITDGFGIVSTSAGDGGTGAYEKWDDGTWIDIETAWGGLDIDLGVFALINTNMYSGNDITSFKFSQDAIPAVIDAENATVSSVVMLGTDLTNLTPTIVVSPGAQVTLTTTDFSSPVELLVAAQDGGEKTWTVTVAQDVLQDKSIYDIQFTEADNGDSPLVKRAVRTKGVVTAVEAKAFYIQDGDGEWNGVYVYQNAAPAVAIGDSVTVEAVVKEYYNLTELANPTAAVINSGNEVAPVEVALGDVAESYEGVFVVVKNVECAEAVNNYGEWIVKDADGNTLKLDDVMFAVTPEVGDMFESITGVITYSYGEYKLLPRSAEDVIQVATVNVTFNVDMTSAGMVDGDVVYVTGNFAGWTEPGQEGSVLMADDDANGIYTATVKVAVDFGELQYKYFLNAGWAGGEWDGDPNRILNVADADIVVDPADVFAVKPAVKEIALSEVSMFPNPVVGNLTIDNLQNATLITVSNILGQKVMNVNITDTRMEIATDGLQRGIYMVTVFDANNNSRTERIIKQ